MTLGFLRRLTLAQRKQSKRAYAYCEKELVKSAIAKHLGICGKQLEAIAKIEAGKATPETLFHLRRQDAYRNKFWLDLEMRGSKALQDLDTCLRAIWIECCGHISQFSLGGGFAKEVGKRQKMSDVFQHGIELTHIYGCETSPEMLVKLMEVRQRKSRT
jgi:hypothetical protein